MMKIKQKTKGYGEVIPSEIKWEDSVKWWDLKAHKELHTNRPVGPTLPVARMWVPVNPKNLHIPKKEFFKVKSFPIWDPSYNPETEEFIKGINPLRDDFGAKAQKLYLGNFIIRELQEAKPASLRPDWTPIRGIKLTKTNTNNFAIIQKLNYDKGDIKKIPRNIEDPVYGCDIHMQYNPTIDGAQKYIDQKGDRTPLTEEEESYKLYEFINIYKPTDPERIKASLLRLGYYNASKVMIPGANVVAGVEEDDEDGIGRKPDTSLEPTTAHQKDVPEDQVSPSEPTNTTQAAITEPEPLTQVSKEQPIEDVEETQIPSSILPTMPSGSNVENITMKEPVNKADDCPADFGQYPKKAACFRCKARNDCIDATPSKE